MLRVLVLALACLCAPARAAAGTGGGAEPFSIAFDEVPASFGSRWGTKIQAEVFRRLGIPFLPRFLSMARRAAMADDGTIDGDNARIRAYGDSHPNLIRVEEPVMELAFGLYTARGDVGVKRLDDLAASPWLVEHRRGVVFCEALLSPLVPAPRLSTVLSEGQGLQKLLAGRTDLFCDLDHLVSTALVGMDAAQATRVRKVIGLGEVPTYLYVHRRHAELVPRLAATIRQLRQEGLIEAYRREAEREVWGGR